MNPNNGEIYAMANSTSYNLESPRDDKNLLKKYSQSQVNKMSEKGSCPYVEGDRVCQLLVRRREKITWDEVETLEELGSTERGVGGFGSTGK